MVAGGGWLTVCFHGLLRHIRKRRAAEHRTLLARGKKVPDTTPKIDGLWQVWFSAPNQSPTASHITPLQAEAVQQYLTLACRCENCLWKRDRNDTEIAGRIKSEHDAIITEEIKALEP